MAHINKHFADFENNFPTITRRIRILIFLLFLSSGLAYLFYYLKSQSLEKAAQQDKFLSVLSAIQSAEVSLYNEIGNVKSSNINGKSQSDEETLLLQADYEMIRSNVDHYTELLSGHLNTLQELSKASDSRLREAVVQFINKATEFLKKKNVNSKAITLYFNHQEFQERLIALKNVGEAAQKKSLSHSRLYNWFFWFFLIAGGIFFLAIIMNLLQLIKRSSTAPFPMNPAPSPPSLLSTENSSEKLLRPDFRGIPGALLALDKSGRILAISEDFISFFNMRFSLNEIIDRQLREFVQFYTEGREVLLPQFMGVVDESLQMELEAHTSEGYQLNVKIRGRISDHSIAGKIWYLLFSEASDPIKIAGNTETDDKIEQLESEVNRLNNLVAELEKYKENSSLLREDFVTNLSHEIRTPLNIIIGYGNLLKDTHLTIEQTEYVNAILTSAYNILSLANNILDAARLDAGMLQLVHEEFNIRNVLASVELMFSHKAHQKKLDFSVYSDPKLPETLVGDSIRFTQILSNLLDNSLKFTSKGFVKLKAELTRETQKDCWVRILVEDSGIGIPEDKIDEIFKRFNQVGRGLDPRFGGSGLGLTIVKSLVDLMGGKIKVESRFGKGTAFIIEIPFAKEQSVSPSSDQLNTVVQSHVLKDRVPKILIVEDNEVNRRLASLLLSKHNFYVETAGNGKEALEKLKNESFDVVLMDVRMPIMDGVEASKRIRNDLKLDIPIIGVTAAVELEEDKELGLNAGMDDFIFKPINPEELLAKINAHLKWTQEKSYGAEFPGATNVWTLPDPVVDLDYLYSITEGNEEFIEDILGTFFSKVAFELDDLVRHCRNRKFDELRFVAHKLKSSFNIIQFNKVVELLNEIDQTQSSEISWTRFDNIVKFIKMLFEKGIEELKERFPEYYNKYYRAPSLPSSSKFKEDSVQSTGTKLKDLENFNKKEIHKSTSSFSRSNSSLTPPDNGKRADQSEETRIEKDVPLVKQLKEKAPSKKNPTFSHRKNLKKVLVADDESLVLKTLKFRLEKEGLEVITATDGKEAIEKFKIEKPDLVITDLMMPFHNGIEVVQAITESDHPCPVIVLSAVGQEKTVIDAFKAGASDFISKPFSPDEINIRLKKFVNS
jgi:signal transduction histidine kinase/DNA-binding response OmpR family regulator